jgi:TatD DNase family protein
MQLFDAHNHIQDDRLFPQLDTVMERAHMAGVNRMAIKGCCESDWPKVLEVVNRYPNAYLAFGLHPWFIGGRSEQCFQVLEGLLTTYPQASVGEIGIDHVVEPRNEEEQEAVFLKQLEMARKMDRPVTIHCRKAWGRLIELLDQFGTLPRGMLIHCFGGSAEVAIELVKRGAYISFSGSISRPNAEQAGPAIRAVPADRILIETDAPDILPHTADKAAGLVVEGRIVNEPANLRHVLAKAAELRGLSEEALAALTFRNAERFFCWSDHEREAHGKKCRMGILPIVPERCGDAAHGLEAHATENSRTGILPVIPEQDGSAAHGQDAHATTSGLPENYAIGNQLEEFYITVVYTWRGNNKRIISARKARKNEQEYYQNETR